MLRSESGALGHFCLLTLLQSLPSLKSEGLTKDVGLSPCTHPQYASLAETKYLGKGKTSDPNPGQ